jgi:hypothetical protein
MDKEKKKKPEKENKTKQYNRSRKSSKQINKSKLVPRALAGQESALGLCMIRAASQRHHAHS